MLIVAIIVIEGFLLFINWKARRQLYFYENSPIHQYLDKKNKNISFIFQPVIVSLTIVIVIYLALYPVMILSMLVGAILMNLIFDFEAYQERHVDVVTCKYCKAKNFAVHYICRKCEHMLC